MGQSGNIEKLETDVVIIGGGGAGLAAAIAASEAGSGVIIIEKRQVTGGNTAMAGGFFAAESPVQRRMNIDASREEFIKIALRFAHWRINPRILRAFVYKSGDTVRWLEEMGLEFEEIRPFYPNQFPPCAHYAKGKGSGLIKVLNKKCEELGLRVIYETAGEKILTDEKGNTIGILAATKGKEFRIIARSVIIATGGFGGNKELLEKYYPFYTETLHSAGLTQNMGDGLHLATEIGAAMEGLGTLILFGPSFRGSQHVTIAAQQPTTLWVNKRGERFVDESTAFLWVESANALNRQPEKISYTLLDETMKQKYISGEVAIRGTTAVIAVGKLTALEEQLRLEAEKGRVKMSSSWDDIAKWIGASPEALKTTVNDYNSLCEQRYDDAFFKDPRFLLPLRTPPYYAIPCVQAFYDTVGGIKIDHEMKVLNQQDAPIPGLYAAGSTTGGWESDTYSLVLSGSAFGFAISSGRIAGENAAKYMKTV
jgi:fumarate reductase flavoprotein subunit